MVLPAMLPIMILSQNVIIKDSGNLTNNNNISNVINYGVLTSKGEYLTGTIENNKTLNLSGSIGKTVSGNGTTYVANSLTFKDGADIVSTLNLSMEQYYQLPEMLTAAMQLEL